MYYEHIITQTQGTDPTASPSQPSLEMSQQALELLREAHDTEVPVPGQN